MASTVCSVSFAVQSLQNGARRPSHRRVEAWCAQAAFFFELHAITLDERRVDERQQVAWIPAHRDVAHEDPHANADLRRRQSHSGRGVHRLDHVVDERLNLRGDRFDWCCRPVQHVGAVADNGTQHREAGSAGRRSGRTRRGESPIEGGSGRRQVLSDFVDRIAAQLLEKGVGEDEGHHRFTDDRRRRHGAHIAALDRGLCVLQRREIHGPKRLA